MPGLSRVCALSGHEERVWSVAWRPRADPVQLASCGADRIIRIWSVKAGAAVDSKDAWSLLLEIDATDYHSRTLRSLAWSPDGKVVAASSFDATVSLWKESKGDEGLKFECVGTVKGHENEVKCSSFSPNGEYFATCSRDKSVWVYETSDQDFDYECAALLQSHTQDVKFVRWHPCQDVLFSCSYDDTIKVWGPDGDDWSCSNTLPGHESTVWALAFDSSGSCFASCSDDRTVRVWVPSAETESKDEASDKQAESKFYGVGAATFVAPLFRAAAGLANLGGQEPIVDKPQKPPSDASCSWSCAATIKGEHPRPVYSVDWLTTDAENSRTVLATACGDNHVRVFEPEQGVSQWRCMGNVEAHDGDANAVAWCPKRPSTGVGLLASAGDDCDVVLWRYED